jgi:hypothetical protein
MIGAIIEVILLGGMGEFLKVSKNSKATNLFKKYKIEPSKTLQTDIKNLKAGGKNGKEALIKTLKAKVPISRVKAKTMYNSFFKLRKLWKITMSRIKSSMKQADMNMKKAAKDDHAIPLTNFDFYKFVKDCFKKVDGTRYALDDRFKKENENENSITKICKKIGSFFNFIKPKNRKTGERVWNAIKSTVHHTSATFRRRLLTKVGEENFDELWVEFTADVQGGQNDKICRNGKNILGNVIVHRDGRFEFSCSNSAELCNCISAVGSGQITTEQEFSNGPLSLILFRHEGHAAYEIKESGEALTYGYVNDGRADRRRRLMQGGTGRTC